MKREQLDPVLSATWPPVSTRTLGPWTLHEGGGGGKRVSAASTFADVTKDDIDRAERAMDDAGQQAMFAVFAGQEDLDKRLSDRTYLCLDPTALYTGSIDSFDVAAATGLDVAISPDITHDACAIWSAGGVGPSRLAIMERVAVPKAVIVLSKDGVPVATAFVAVKNETVMLHALEVSRPARRQGAGLATMRAAAAWGRRKGATKFALLVTQANEAANALYRHLGLTAQPCYHYRIRP